MNSYEKEEENVEKTKIYQNLLDFQISWDFATNIVELFRKRFSKSQKNIKKLEKS